MATAGWYSNEDVERALEIARETRKPILIDFWSSTCLGCAKLAKVTYADSSVQAFIRENFVPIKFRTSDTPGKFRNLNGRAIHMWHPHLLVTDYRLTEARRMVGHLSPISFVAHLRVAIGLMALYRKDYPDAKASFEAAVASTAPAEVIAESLYWLGVAEYRVTRSLPALKDVWEKLRSRYPDSDWADRANCLDVEIPETGFDIDDSATITLISPPRDQPSHTLAVL